MRSCMPISHIHTVLYCCQWWFSVLSCYFLHHVYRSKVMKIALSSVWCRPIYICIVTIKPIPLTHWTLSSVTSRWSYCPTRPVGIDYRHLKASRAWGINISVLPGLLDRTGALLLSRFLNICILLQCFWKHDWIMFSLITEITNYVYRVMSRYWRWENDCSAIFCHHFCNWSTMNAPPSYAILNINNRALRVERCALN